MSKIKELMSFNRIKKNVGIRASTLLFFCFVISIHSHAIEQYGLPIADYPQKGKTYHVTTSLKQTRTQETIRRGRSSMKTKTQGMIFDGNLTWENVGLDKDVELRMTVHKFLEFDDDGTHSLLASDTQIIRKKKVR